MIAERILIGLIYYIVLMFLFTVRYKISTREILISFSVFFVVLSASIINTYYQFIDEKIASFVSYNMHTKGTFSLSFYVQYLLSLPMYKIMGNEYTSHSLNAVIHAITILSIYRFIFQKKFTWLFVVVLLFPSYYHYSIFGLRDPLVNLVMTFFVIYTLKFSAIKSDVLIILLALISIGIRPELSVILLSFIWLRHFLTWRLKTKIILVLISIPLMYIILLQLPKTLGIKTTATSVNHSLELVSEFNEARYNRRLDGGGSGSHILAGKLFDYSFVERYPIQLLASFISPLPFEIKNKLHLLSFLESILFTLIAIIAFQKSRNNRMARYLFYCGMIYILSQAIFASNYGNVVRLRYPVFILFVSSIYFSKFGNIGTSKPKPSSVQLDD